MLRYAALASLLLAAAPAFGAGLAVPVYAYVLPDGSLGEICEGDCLKNLANRLRNRRGVKGSSVEGKEVRLQIEPGVFRSNEVIKGIDGMKVEMRVPYSAIEIHFVPQAPFGGQIFRDGELLVVELSEPVKKAIEEAVDFKLQMKMKCLGKVVGDQANEAVLARYEVEKLPLWKMVPFMAEADLDGDKRPDLYLRLTGLPEVVVFNKADGPKAKVVTAQKAVEEIPRCEQAPMRFARPVARPKVKCINTTPPHDGEAIERVEMNRSTNLLMFGNGAFATCEPLGEGAIPVDPVKKVAKPNKPKDGKDGKDAKDKKPGEGEAAPPAP